MLNLLGTNTKLKNLSYCIVFNLFNSKFTIFLGLKHQEVTLNFNINGKELLKNTD